MFNRPLVCNICTRSFRQTSFCLQSERLLLLLDSITLCLGSRPVVCLHLCTLDSQTLVDLLFGVVTATGGFVHKASVVTLFEGGDDFFARYVI